MSIINTVMHKTLKYIGLRFESYKIINMRLVISPTNRIGMYNMAEVLTTISLHTLNSYSIIKHHLENKFECN